jgi:hypothetical protein
MTARLPLYADELAGAVSPAFQPQTIVDSGCVCARVRDVVLTGVAQH